MEATGASTVQLVVKAPNQQIDDQLIVCAVDWTVLAVKQHLSRVYPSQPVVEDQKLIYSGQLLHNHLTLKDFLRQYETETVHTLHLVCVGCKDSYCSPASKNSKTTNTSSSSAHSSGSSPAVDTTSTDGLRHRNTHPVDFPMVGEPIMGMQPFVADVTGMPAQMAWMNQMYSQYMNVYYQQYLGQMQQSTGFDQRSPMTNSNAYSTPDSSNAPPAATATPTSPRIINNNNNNNVNNNAPVEQAVAPVAGVAAVAGAVNAERQPLPNMPGMMGAAAAVADDDNEDQQGNANRDWLDWTYSICRAAVLFVIIHYYSSVGRFAVVALVAALIYVHQMGWLDPRMRRPVARPNRVNPHAEVRPRGVQADPAGPAAPVNDDEPAPEDDQAVEEQHEIRELEMLMNHEVDEPNANQRDGPSSLVNTAWTIVATFFSSLLPERPEQAML